MKKKLLFSAIRMDAAGTERALLSLLGALDFSEYDITLLLAQKEGPLLPLIPKEVRVTELGRDGTLFSLSAKNAKRVLSAFALRHPSALPRIAKAALNAKKRPETRKSEAVTLFSDLIKRYFPAFEPETEYDAAISFSGARTLFYTVEKVRAKKKIAWHHFTFDPKETDPAAEYAYFSRADRIAAVSDAAAESLKSAFPDLSEKITVFPNRIDRKLIRKLAEEGTRLTGPGLRILTLSRVSEKKGCDKIPAVLEWLTRAGLDCHWTLIGKDEGAKWVIEKEIRASGLSERFACLPPTENPYGCLASADLFVLPSKNEGYPVSVEEAKALGVPSVVLPYGAAEEQLGYGTYGIVTDVLEDGVLSLARDEERRKAIRDTLLSLPEPADNTAERFRNLLM